MTFSNYCRRLMKWPLLNSNKSASSVCFFYLAFAIFSIMFGISKINWTESLTGFIDVLCTLLKVITLVLLAIKSAFQKYPVSKIIIIFACGIFLFVSARFAQFSTLIWSYIFIITGQGVRLKEMARILLTITTVFFFITVCFYLVGIASDYLMMRSDDMIRLSWGFAHPNILGLSFIIMAVCYLTTRFPEFELYDFVVCVAFAVCPLLVANSRSSVLIIFFATLLFWNASRRSKGKHTTISSRMIAVIVIILVFVLSIAFMVSYDDSVPWQFSINKVLTGRLYLGNYYYSNYGITWLGSQIPSDMLAPDTQEMGFRNSFLVDNAIMRVLIRYGIIPFLILLTGTIALMLVASNHRDSELIYIGVALTWLLGFSESCVLDISSNIFLITYALPLYGFEITRKRQIQRYRVRLLV